MAVCMGNYEKAVSKLGLRMGRGGETRLNRLLVPVYIQISLFLAANAMNE